MCEEFKNRLIKYLRDASIFTEDECVWDIEEREPFGRCLIAKRDIQVNELILRDKPLVVGPRVNNYEKIFCVSCYRVIPKLTLCDMRCKFPVCDDCTYSKQHVKECELIRSWQLKNEIRYSKHLFRALTVIRGLLISEDDAALMMMMAKHDNSSMQNIEVDKMIAEFNELPPDSATVKRLKDISSILNTNAFEVGIAHDSMPKEIVSLRGLYPLSAVMNHNCVPNIRYAYEKNGIMVVRASKLIRKGEQIFNSYTKFLWGTQQRRVHLAYSKNFLCKCTRCEDRTEFGSYMGALKCVRPQCGKLLVPKDPLSVVSPWQCDSCNLSLDHARISKIYDIASKQVFHKILNEPMRAVNQYLKEKLPTFLPTTNQFCVELKLQIILKMKKEIESELTLDDHRDVERYCYDVLSILETLDCGECFVKGLLYYELMSVKLKIAELTKETFDEETRRSMKEMSQKCSLILGNTTMEPEDLKTFGKKFS